MKFFKNLLWDIRKNRMLLLMLVPGVLFFTLFSYIPMSGIVLAFKRLDNALGIFASPWVGFDNFRFFFISGQAFTVTRNTFLYNTAFITVGIILQVSVAIMLSEILSKKFKRVTQSFMFLPYFISWVIVGAFVYNFFNYDYGMLNSMLKALGAEPVDVNSTPEFWKYILVFFQSWKNIGYGSVVYLAAIMSIDSEMYEAAHIDGSSIWQRIWYITLPSLKPTIIILTLLNIGNIFRGDLNMFFQLVGRNGLLFNATDVIDTFVFRSLLSLSDYGMAAAVGLYQSVLCFIILVTTNYVIRKTEPDYALF